MPRYQLAEARKSFTDIVNRVAYGGERIAIGRHDKDLAVLISVDDAALLEELEDMQDAKEAKKILAEMKRSRDGGVPWEDVKAELSAKRAGPARDGKA